LYTMARVSLYPLAACPTDPAHFARDAVGAPHSWKLTSPDSS